MFSQPGGLWAISCRGSADGSACMKKAAETENRDRSNIRIFLKKRVAFKRDQEGKQELSGRCFAWVQTYDENPHVAPVHYSAYRIRSPMHHIQGCDRNQTLLLPNSVDDYISPDNPVRFVDAFVEQLDLQGAGFCRVEPKETGRPGYHPADLLKLYIYGYLNRVRSSRRLEAETKRNLEVMWLLRGLTPDFKTIADFRKDNRDAFKPVFRQFVLLCRKLDLFGGELLAVDGTRLKAVKSTERNFTNAKLTKQIESIDQKLTNYLERLDRCDVQEAEPSTARAGRLTEKIATLRTQQKHCHAMLQELERTGESQISLTDPDSRAMAMNPKVGVGYNAQVAVDSKHKLIVEQKVTNAGTDLGLLAPTASAAKEVLEVEQIKVVADSGYYKGEDIAACEAAGIEAYVPRPQRGFAVQEGLFCKEEFHYDAQNDVYICPGNQQLHPRYRSSGDVILRLSLPAEGPFL